MAGERVLILEDDDDLRDLLIFTLEDEGYAVRGCRSAIVALRLLASWDCQLVVTDIRLGGLDGLSCLRLIKEKRPQMKSIVITGYADMDCPARALEVAVDDYLYKPFEVADFQSAIRRTLRGEEERAAYLRLFDKVAGGCRWCWELARRSIDDRRWRSLQGYRDKCFRDFFVGVRSGGLSLGGALLAWDELERIEAASETARESGIAVNKLADGYRCVSDFIHSNLNTPRIMIGISRDKGAISREAFLLLFQRLRSGELSLEQLRLAPELRRHGEALQSPQSRTLFERIWGRREERPTPWAQARISLEKGTGIWSKF